MQMGFRSFRLFTQIFRTETFQLHSGGNSMPDLMLTIRDIDLGFFFFSEI